MNWLSEAGFMPSGLDLRVGESAPSTLWSRFYSLVTSNIGKSQSSIYGGDRAGLPMSKKIVAGRKANLR